MEKRCQVFVSSTFTDLTDERCAVMQALLELNYIRAGRRAPDELLAEKRQDV